MTVTPPPNTQDDSLVGVMASAWQLRKAVLAGAVLGLIVGLVLVAVRVPQYEASMIIAPPLLDTSVNSLDQFETGSDAALRGQGDRRDLLPPEYVRFTQILRGESVAKILSRYDGVLEELGNDRQFSLQSTAALTPDMVPEYLFRHVRIEPVAATTSLRIAYRHPDRDFAVRLLKHLHTIGDATLRQRATKETQERIAWLQKQMNQSGNPDHRKALANLVMAQERRRMLAAMDQPFAADIVEAPSAYAKPVGISSWLLVSFAMLIGAVLGYMLQAVRLTLRAQ